MLQVDGTAASGVLLSRNVSIPYLLRQFGGAKAGDMQKMSGEHGRHHSHFLQAFLVISRDPGTQSLGRRFRHKRTVVSLALTTFKERPGAGHGWSKPQPQPIVPLCQGDADVL